MDFSDFKRQAQNEDKDRFQREKQEIREQQMPKQSPDFDPQKFLREQSGIPASKLGDKCPDCNNTGIVKEGNGVVHTCWKCLQEGKLDCHSKKLPDNNIRI